MRKKKKVCKNLGISSIKSQISLKSQHNGTILCVRKDLPSKVLQVILEIGPVHVNEILQFLEKRHHLHVEKEEIHSLLYGDLRELVIRDKDEKGFPAWRAKGVLFEAAKGLEVSLYNELLKRNIIERDSSQLDFPVRDRL